jgi:hypothetical protein
MRSKLLIAAALCIGLLAVAAIVVGGDEEPHQ